VTQLDDSPVTGSRPLRKAAPPGQLSGWIALGVVWVVWGSTYLAIRVGDRTLPPFTLAAVRYLVAGLVLFPLALAGARRARRPGSSRLAQWAGPAVVGTLLLAFGNGGVCYAERTLPSGLAALLVASVPLWMVLADWVINGRRPRAGGWLALALGLAGVAVLAQPHGHGDILAVLVVLGASVSWGTGSVLAGRLPAPDSPFLGSAMQMLAGGAVLTGIAAATGELAPAEVSHVSAQSLLALFYLIGPGSLLALTCYVIALRRLPISTVSTYAYVNPVVAVSLGALILGEPLTGATALGGVIIVAAVALLVTSQARRPRGESPARSAVSTAPEAPRPAAEARPAA